MRALSSRSGRSAPACDLAVLVHEFPKLSETFVVGDLLGLQSRGVRLHVFSLRRPQSDLSNQASERLQASVEYFPEFTGRQLVLLRRAAHATLLMRDPRRYARALGQIYASPDFNRGRFQQAVLLARRLDQLGSPPLYIHFAHKPATVGRFAALLAGVPFAISAHSVDIWASPTAELEAKFIDASAVLCCYQEARDFVRGLVNGHTPIELAHHGVVIPPHPRRDEVSPPLLLSVGRLVEKKGFDTLVRAARLMRDRGLEFRVRVVGDGVLWPTLQRLVNELELGETVSFIGPLTEEELDEHYAQATAFVLACQVSLDGNRDGMPNTMLEAMARELPVVSTTLGSIAEAITDGEHGLLVAPRDHVALANALTRLLGDRSLREQLGRAARARVRERYDRAVLAPRVFEVLSAAGMFD